MPDRNAYDPTNRYRAELINKMVEFAEFVTDGEIYVANSYQEVVDEASNRVDAFLEKYRTLEGSNQV